MLAKASNASMSSASNEACALSKRTHVFMLLGDDKNEEERFLMRERGREQRLKGVRLENLHAAWTSSLRGWAAGACFLASQSTLPKPLGEAWNSKKALVMLAPSWPGLVSSQ